ncbi:mediator complex subunit [Sorochytrium milnesiophthora]
MTTPKADKEMARRLFGPHDPHGRLSPNTVNMVLLRVVASSLLRKAHSDFVKLLNRGDRRTSDDNKAAVLQYLVKYRTHFAHLVAVTRWSQQAQSVMAVQSIIARLQRDDNVFEQACQSLNVASQQLAMARTRNYDVLTAVDVLSTGTMSLFPKVILGLSRFSICMSLWANGTFLPGEQVVKQSLVADRPLTQSEINSSLRELDSVIRRRLLFQECGVPQELLQRWSIRHGRATFRVENEFAVTLTLPAGPDPEGPWEVLDLEIFSGTEEDGKAAGNSLSHAKSNSMAHDALFLHQVYNVKLLARDILYPRPTANSTAVADGQTPSTAATPTAGDTPRPLVRLPLLELYHFLHHFTLSLRLERIYYSLVRLAKSTWRGRLRIQRDDEQHRVIVRYWPQAARQEPGETNGEAHESPCLVIGITQTDVVQSIDLSRLSGYGKPPDPECPPTKPDIGAAEATATKLDYSIKQSQFDLTLPMCPSAGADLTVLNPLTTAPYLLLLSALRLHARFLLLQLQRQLLAGSALSTPPGAIPALALCLPLVLPLDGTQIEVQDLVEPTIFINPHPYCRLRISVDLATGMLFMGQEPSVYELSHDLPNAVPGDMASSASEALMRTAQQALNRSAQDVLLIVNTYRISAFLERFAHMAEYHGFKPPTSPLRMVEPVFGASRHMLFLSLSGQSSFYLVLNVVNNNLAAWLADIKSSSVSGDQVAYACQINLQYLLNIHAGDYWLGSVERAMCDNNVIATLQALCRNHIALSFIKNGLAQTRTPVTVASLTPLSLFLDQLDQGVLRVPATSVTTCAKGLGYVFGTVFIHSIKGDGDGLLPEVCFTLAVNADALPVPPASFTVDLSTLSSSASLGSKKSGCIFTFDQTKSRFTFRYKDARHAWSQFRQEFAQVCLLARLAKSVWRSRPRSLCNGHATKLNGYSNAGGKRRKLSVQAYDFLHLDFLYGGGHGIRLRLDTKDGPVGSAQEDDAAAASLALTLYTTRPHATLGNPHQCVAGFLPGLLRQRSAAEFVDYLLGTQSALLCMQEVLQDGAGAKSSRHWPPRLLQRSALGFRLLYYPTFGIDVKFLADLSMVVLSDAGWSPFDSANVRVDSTADETSQDKACVPIAFRRIPNFDALLAAICDLARRPAVERSRGSPQNNGNGHGAAGAVGNGSGAVASQLAPPGAAMFEPDDLLEMLDFGSAMDYTPTLASVQSTPALVNGKHHNDDAADVHGGTDSEDAEPTETVVLRLQTAVAISIGLFPRALRQLHRFMSGSSTLTVLQEKAKAYPELSEITTDVSLYSISFVRAGAKITAAHTDGTGWTMQAAHREKSASETATNPAATEAAVDDLTPAEVSGLSAFLSAKGIRYRNTLEFVEASFRFTSLPLPIIKQVLSLVRAPIQATDSSVQCDLQLMVPDPRPFSFLPAVGSVCLLLSKDKQSVLLLFEVSAGVERKHLPLHYDLASHAVSIWPDQEDTSLAQHSSASMPMDTNLLISQLMQRSLRSKLETILQGIVAEAPEGLKLAWCVRKLLARPLSDLAL